MKLIFASFRPDMERDVVRALRELPDFPGYTIVEARGQGSGAGAHGAFVPALDHVGDHPKLLLHVICRDDVAEQVRDAIARSAHTGRKGDGVVAVLPADTAIRIRTGDTLGETRT